MYHFKRHDRGIHSAKYQFWTCLHFNKLQSGPSAQRYVHRTFECPESALSLSHSLTHSHTHTHTHTHTVLLGLLPQQKTTDSFKFWTEVTSVEYTWSLRHYQRKESVGVKLGDLGNHAMSPLLRIDVPGMVLSIH